MSDKINNIMRFDVEFPPGPMGLELEPVITSSECEIGCRVRDYYFGIDHKGINPDFVKSKIAIGDIILKLNDENLLSTKFQEILEKLKICKDKSRIVTFKILSMEGRSERLTSPLKIKSEKSPVSPKANTILSVKTPDKDLSPFKFTGVDSKLDKVNDENTKQSNPLLDKKNMSNSENNDISNSIKSSALINGTENTNEEKDDNAVSMTDLSPPTTLDFQFKSVQSLLSPEMTRILGAVGESIGYGIVNVSSTVTHQAADVALAVGATVGDQTEKLVYRAAEIMPKYSETEVRLMMSKKDVLLNELSRTYLLLGQAEDNKHTLEVKTEALIQKQQELEQTVHQQRLEYENLKATLTKDKEQYMLLLNECNLLKKQIEDKDAENRHVKDEFQSKYGEILEQLTISQQAVHIYREELQNERNLLLSERDKWKHEAHQMVMDDQAARREIYSALEAANLRIHQIEEERDAAKIEITELRKQLDFDFKKSDSKELNKNDSSVLLQARIMELEKEQERRMKETDLLRIQNDRYQLLISELEDSQISKDTQKGNIDDLNQELITSNKKLEVGLNTLKSALYEEQILHTTAASRALKAEHDASIYATERNELKSLVARLKDQLSSQQLMQQDEDKRISSQSIELQKQTEDKESQFRARIQNIEADLVVARSQETLRIQEKNNLQYELEAKIATLQQEGFQLNRTIQYDRDSSSVLIDRLKQEVSEARNKIISLETKSLETQKSLNEANHASDIRVNCMSDIIDKLEKKAISLENELQKSNLLILEKDKVIQSLQGNLNSEADKSVAYDTSFDVLQAEVNRLRTSLQVANQANSSTSRKVISLCRPLLEKATQLKMELQTLRGDCQEVTNIQSLVQRTTLQVQDLVKRKTEQDVEQLKSSLIMDNEVLRKQIKNANQELIIKNDEIIDLKTKLSKLTDEFKTKNSSYDQVHETTIAQKEKFEEMIRNLSNEVSSLQKELGTEKQKCFHLEIDSNTLQKTNGDLLSEVDRLREKISHLQNDLEDSQKQYLNSMKSNSESISKLSNQIRQDAENQISSRLNLEFDTKLTVLQTESIELKKRVAIAESKAEEAERKLKDFHHNQDNQSIEIWDFNRRLETINLSFSREKSEIMNSYETKLQELKIQLEQSYETKCAMISEENRKKILLLDVECKSLRESERIALLAKHELESKLQQYSISESDKVQVQRLLHQLEELESEKSTLSLSLRDLRIQYSELLTVSSLNDAKHSSTIAELNTQLSNEKRLYLNNLASLQREHEENVNKLRLDLQVLHNKFMLTTAESNKEYKAIQDKLESDEVALHSARIEIETITKQKLLMEQENQKLMEEINMTNTKLSNMLTERESLQRHAEELSKSISFLSDKFQSISHNSSNQNADLVLSENQLLKSKIMQQDAELKSLKLNQTELLEALSSQMRALEQAELSEIDHQRSQARVDALITSMELQYNNVVAKSIATEQSAIVRVKELEKQLQELISQSKLDRSNSNDYHEKDQQLKSLHVQLKEAKGLLNLTTEALSLGSYM